MAAKKRSTQTAAPSPAKINQNLEPLTRPIESLTLDTRNARRHNKRSVESIKASLATYGQQKPIVILSSGVVIAGNGTLTAARELGWDRLAVVAFDNEDEARARAFAIMDNRSAEFSDWDEEELAKSIGELPDDLLQSIGFNDVEIDRIIKQEINPEPQDAPNVKPEADSVSGRIYELGNHRLACGDSCNAEVWKSLMGQELGDLVITDPPYGVSYVGGTKDALKIENDDLDADGLQRLLFASLGNAANFSRDGAVWYVFSPSSDLFAEFAEVLGRRGLKIWKHTLAWVKDRLVLGRADYHYRHEAIFYGWKPGAAHFFVGDRAQDSVIECDRPSRNEDHPTMKPIELLQRLVRNSSRRGDVVVDAFGGSGSTLIAAETEGRRARIVELDPRYCDVIRRRWTRYADENNLEAGSGALR